MVKLMSNLWSSTWLKLQGGSYSRYRYVHIYKKFEGWVRSSRFAFFAFSNWNSNFPHVLYSISEGYHAESSFVNKHIWDTFTFLCNRFKCKRNPILDVENRPKCSIEWVCCWGARPWLLKDWSRRAFIHYFGEFRQVLACYITDIWILKAPIFFVNPTTFVNPFNGGH